MPAGNEYHSHSARQNISLSQEVNDMSALSVEHNLAGLRSEDHSLNARLDCSDGDMN